MFIHTQCPIGGSEEQDVELYPANVDLTDLTSSTFSARRLPDRIHFRTVRNTETGCVRADPILDEESLSALYRASEVSYEPLGEYAAETYLRYIRRALPHLPDRRGLLEVGCGHGFFLEKLEPLHFETVAGVEPSSNAVEKASPETRDRIVEDTLHPGLFDPESFSLICGFQVLDHLADPNAALETCRELLTPGGAMLWICHDIGSLLARLLGERCPMVDVQHMVLYDRRTVRALFESNGFEVVDVFGVTNRYPLGYWAYLAPLPQPLKRWFLSFLKVTRLERIPIAINPGNLGILARKPGQDGRS